ncbi:hypothetical protein VCEM1676A_001008 [Vibrio cholerae O1 str. EM-1676A]|nr:hypothetical protein VCEM1676A_001008 [Vibrio cholerae O1 str. EM-1676A]
MVINPLLAAKESIKTDFAANFPPLSYLLTLGLQIQLQSHYYA